MKSFVHVIADSEGLHARSCVIIVNEARKWTSSVAVSFGDMVGSARSMSELLALHAKRGDAVVVSCEGPDEAEAAVALESLMRMSI